MGLKYATGEYISFVDSDDIVPGQSYERLIASAERFGSDMVIGPYQSFCNGKTWHEVPVHKQMLKQKIICTDIFHFPDLLEDISVCNRIIKRSVIEEFQVVFPEQYAGEDVVFMAHLYLKCKTISIVPSVVYCCRRKREEASSSRITADCF